MRIVSLLPSATEIVCLLGLEDQLVGVTHECDFPSSVTKVAKVTYTMIPHGASSASIDSLVREQVQADYSLYSLNREALAHCQPDLIITQTLCNVCAVAESEVVSAIAELKSQPVVINLEPSNLAQVFESVLTVAQVAQVPQKGEAVVSQLQERIDSIRAKQIGLKRRPSVVVLEWIDPPFSAGHWTPELVHLAGGVECLGAAGQKSQTLTWDTLQRVDPEFLILSCCGFSSERTLLDIPKLRSYPGFDKLQCVKNQNVFIIDGNAYLSRPGPRLVDGVELVAHILNPDRHPMLNHLIPALRLRQEQLTY